MPTDIPTGDSGSGFLTSTAGLLVLVLLVVVAVALPTFRSVLGDHVEQFRAYFFGPRPAAETDAAEAGPDGTDASGTDLDDSSLNAAPSSGRASDRESFDFNLDVFGPLFDGTVDDSSPPANTP